MWLVMLNYYDLGCMQVGLKSFMVSVDYRVYMGSSVTSLITPVIAFVLVLL